MEKKRINIRKLDHKHMKKIFDELEKNPLPNVSSNVDPDAMSGEHLPCKKKS